MPQSSTHHSGGTNFASGLALARIHTLDRFTRQRNVRTQDNNSRRGSNAESEQDQDDPDINPKYQRETRSDVSRSKDLNTLERTSVSSDCSTVDGKEEGRSGSQHERRRSSAITVGSQHSLSSSQRRNSQGSSLDSKCDPRFLLLRRNPFEKHPVEDDTASQGGEFVQDASQPARGLTYSLPPAVATRSTTNEATIDDAIQREEAATDIGKQRIPLQPLDSAPDITLVDQDGGDDDSNTDPVNPARILKRSDLKRQRTFFFSIVIAINLAALLGAIFVGGTWVFAFILFVKSKDTLSVFGSAASLLCSSIWHFFSPPKPVSPKWILSLVPTYLESEEQIIKTLISLKDNGLTNHNQVLCVIMDGKHRDISRHIRIIKPFRRPYITSKFQKSALTIDAGYIDGIPIICIEKARNAGKKDTLILCHDLFNVMRENAPLYTKLLRSEIWDTVLPQLMKLSPVHFTKFDMIFTTDADSIIYKGAIATLANAIARNKNAIAACGLVLVELEEGYKWSRWNLYQQFQYTFGQYIRRRAESAYGKVTCLPGCISMFSVRPEMAAAIRKYAEPITAYPVLLHQVQYLGTDRRLTYSMLSQNKKLQTLFVPEAISETVAPQTLHHYLSQRRRWGSNAYFNNFFFCFGEKMVLLTRLAAAIELVRLTMVYYRVANTVMFVVGLATQNVTLVRIIALLVVSQLPSVWFAVCILVVEKELRKRAVKLLLGYAVNKVMSPFLSVVVFSTVLRSLGSQVWGMTGGSSSGFVTKTESSVSVATTNTATTRSSVGAPAHASLDTPDVSSATPKLEEPLQTNTALVEVIEGGLGEQLAELSEAELQKEERNEKLAGAEEPIPPFG